MSSPLQGTPGPSGSAGSQSASIQPLGANHTALMSKLSQLGQTSPEQSVSNQIRKLTVGHSLIPSISSGLTVYPVIQVHRRNVRDIARGIIHDPVRQMEFSPNLGIEDGDVTHKLQPTQSTAELVSVHLVLLILTTVELLTVL